MSLISNLSNLSIEFNIVFYWQCLLNYRLNDLIPIDFSWFIRLINIAILFFWFILMINIATALFLKNYISNIRMIYLLRNQLKYSNPILILFNQFNLGCSLLFSRYIFYSWSFFSYNFLLEFSSLFFVVKIY
jgi:hypothetical protein